MSKNSHSMHATVHNTCSTQRRWLFSSWLLALSLFSVSDYLLAAAPARGNSDGEATATPEKPFSLYTTKNMKAGDVGDAVELVSVLDNHRAILYCTALTPGKTYRGSWSLKDPSGQEFLTETNFVFVATESHLSTWRSYVAPERLPAAGTWTWRVMLEGQGPLSKQITMLPPTKDEAETLASFQQVRENVLHAFSLSWRFHEGCFFTVVEGGTSTERLIQVTNLSPHFTSEHVSPADKLNGFSYRSKATFSFQVWRQFTSDGGWTEWENVTEHANAFSESFDSAFVANVPESFKQNFKLGFSAYLKDGHCKLVADDQSEFVDRRQIGHANRIIQCPAKQFVQKALSEGGSLRKSERAAVDKLRTQPESTVEGIQATMDAIRAAMGPFQSILLLNHVPAPAFER